MSDEGACRGAGHGEPAAVGLMFSPPAAAHLSDQGPGRGGNCQAA